MAAPAGELLVILQAVDFVLVALARGSGRRGEYDP
jgi:hypothetical protein